MQEQWGSMGLGERADKPSAQSGELNFIFPFYFLYFLSFYCILYRLLLIKMFPLARLLFFIFFISFFSPCSEWSGTKPDRLLDLIGWKRCTSPHNHARCVSFRLSSRTDSAVGCKRRWERKREGEERDERRNKQKRGTDCCLVETALSARHNHRASPSWTFFPCLNTKSGLFLALLWSLFQGRRAIRGCCAGCPISTSLSDRAGPV